eukprot:8535063-Alexandrium_andersonii.AAC.1
MRQALASRTESRCPDAGHGDPRNDPSSYDGEAIMAGGVRARAPVGVVGTAGLRTRSQRLVHVQWG